MSFLENTIQGNEDFGKMNSVTLSFDKKLESDFLHKYFLDSLKHFRLSFVIVSILYGTFHYLDAVTVPELRQIFFVIRFGIVIPFLMLVLVLSFFSFFEKIWQLLLFMSTVISGIGIAQMLIFAPTNILYYGGMMLIFSAGYFFIKLRFVLAALAGWIIIIYYNIGAIFFSETPAIMLLNINFFYVSANLIGMFASYNTEHLIRSDFFQKKQLDMKNLEMEETNRTLELKVEERTKELLAEKEKAEQSDKLKTAFLANMSHEIRTPIHGILGFSQLLLESEDTEDFDKYVKIIYKNGTHLLSLINDIIDISKIEAGMISLTLSEFSLNSLIEEVYQLFTLEEKVLTKQIEIRQYHDFEKGYDIITSDRTRLKQVLINLLSNACKFTNKGFVEIGYISLDNEILFYVKDTGIGLTPEQQDYIFERFMQVNLNHNSKQEGTGLGLAISKAYVKLFEGDIWVDSIPGHGSIFCFNLPKYNNGNSILKQQINPEIKMNLEWTDKVILLAEDVAMNYLLIKSALKKTGVNLIWVQNGREAVDYCKNNKNIDLILMDMRMPILDGFEAVLEIREFNTEIPIIAQTSYAMDGDRDKCLAYGCNDYISKPFIVKDFIDLIGIYINR